MSGIVSVPPTQPTSNTPEPLKFPWDIQSKSEMAAWLQSNADRLIVRAKRHPNRAERDRLLRMAAAAIETAGWYQNDGGAR